MKSAYFSNRALKAFNRMGDVLLPKNGQFPSFSEFGGIEHIDDLVQYAPKGDIKDLNLLMTILSFMPTFVLRWLVNKMQNAGNMGDGGIGTLFRMLNFGIRGLLFSCYYTEKTGSTYTGEKPIDLVGYDAKRVSL